MDKRLDTSRSDCREDISSHSKKNKKRSSKRDSVFGPRANNAHNNQNNDIASGMEYQHIMWQPNVQHNFPNNGQRLFATTSDPSVCGYTPMPMTYAMEPVSLPAMYRLYQPVPVPSIRTIDGRSRRHSNQKHPINLGPNVHSMANGYTSLQENGTGSPIPLNYQNGDYTSLPPSASKSNEINGDELNSEHRRYSDPGLGPAEAPVNTQSDDSDSADSGSSIMTIGHGNKLILSLIEQMTELKKSNSQLFKELSETKSELETVKSKLTRCKHSSSTDYQPGMFSDLIREIREANKACEEAVVARAESMLQEKFSQRSLEVEKLNNQILQLTKEKEETNKRIAKLEEDVATLKLNANNEGREIAAFEEETLALRRELQEARASRNLAENHMANPMPVESYRDSWILGDRRDPCADVSVSSIQQSSAAVGSTNDIHDCANECSDTKTEKLLSFSSLEKVSKKEDVVTINDGKLGNDINAVTTSKDVTENSEDTREGSIEERCDVKVWRSDSETKPNPVLEKLVETATTSITEKESSENVQRRDQRSQKGNSKKSRRKKGSAAVKRSLSETDKPSKTPDGAPVSAASMNNNLSKDNRRTVSEDEDCLDDDQTSRAITEIPEVAVVGGGSFVPKDLCPARILTSRVLTAPSRATYTTAYI